MKKKISLLVAGTLTVGLFAGCSGTKNTATGGKTDLLIGLPGGDGVTDMRVVDNFIAARSDRYNITLDEAGWGDFVQKVKLQMVAKNDVVPVFFIDSAGAMSFGEQGALKDLSTSVNADLDTEKYSKALTAVTNPEGKLWGVPHAINSIALLYNKDIFDEKGVAYPTDEWTFQDMLDVAKTLTFDRDGDGKIDVNGIHYTTNITQGWYPFMQAYGVSPLSEDFRDSNLNDPLIKDAMTSYAESFENGSQPNPADIAAQGGILAAFADGKVAMCIAQFGNITTINKFNPDLNYDAAIMPIGWNGERTCIYVPNVWCIYEGVDQNVYDAAWDWISYFLNEESQMLQAESIIAGFPILNKAMETISNNGVKPEGKDAFYRGIDAHGTTILENPCSSDVNSLIAAMCHKISLGEVSVEEGLAETHTELQETLDYFYEQLG